MFSLWCLNTKQYIKLCQLWSTVGHYLFNKQYATRPIYIFTASDNLLHDTFDWFVRFYDDQNYRVLSMSTCLCSNVSWYCIKNKHFTFNSTRLTEVGTFRNYYNIDFISTTVWDMTQTQTKLPVTDNYNSLVINIVYYNIYNLGIKYIV